MKIIFRVLFEANRFSPFYGVIFNQRWNSISIEFVDNNGHVCVDYIPVPIYTDSVKCYSLRIKELALYTYAV